MVKVVEVRGSIVQLTAHPDVRLKTRLELSGETLPTGSLMLEVREHSRHDRIFALALGPTTGVFRGMEAVVPKWTEPKPFNPGWMYDGLGNVIKETKPSVSESTENGKPSESRRFETGIIAIDLLAPIAKGGRTGIFGGAGVGKTVTVQWIVQNFLNPDPATGKRAVKRAVVIAGVGERIREAQEVYEKLKDQPNCYFLFGQMDRPAGERFSAAINAAQLASDLAKNGYEVLFFIDNLYRYVQAGMEISSSLRRMPGVLGYQPTIDSEVGDLLELLNSDSNSITTIGCVYVPSDDYSDPGVAAILRQLDTSIILSRELSNLGRYPAVDPLESEGYRFDDDLSKKLHACAQEIKNKIANSRLLEQKVKYFGKAALDPNEKCEFAILEKLKFELLKQNKTDKPSWSSKGTLTEYQKIITQTAGAT